MGDQFPANKESTAFKAYNIKNTVILICNIADRPEYLKSLICPNKKCLQIMHDARILECGHSFCNNCIETVNKRVKCQLCNNYSNSSAPNHLVNNITAMLKIRCKNNNCEWVGGVSDYKTHYMDCSKTVTCQDCKTTVLKTDLEKHINECEFRTVLCYTCYKTGYAKHYEDHKKQFCKPPIMYIPDEETEDNIFQRLSIADTVIDEVD